MTQSLNEHRLIRENATLRAKVEDLEYRLSELFATEQECPIRMTRTQFRFANFLARRSPLVIPYRAFVYCIETDPDHLVDAEQLAHVHIHHTRKHLRPHGVTIETIRGTGYRMPRESAERWKAMVAAANGQEQAA